MYNPGGGAARRWRRGCSLLSYPISCLLLHLFFLDWPGCHFITMIQPVLAQWLEMRI
jgi:hypothetical protein